MTRGCGTPAWKSAAAARRRLCVPQLEASPPTVRMLLVASARKARVERTPASSRDGVTSLNSHGPKIGRRSAGMPTPERRWASACTSTGHISTAAGPGGCRAFPAAVKPLAMAAGTFGAAASSRSIAHRTGSTSGAAPEPGSVGPLACLRRRGRTWTQKRRLQSEYRRTGCPQTSKAGTQRSHVGPAHAATRTRDAAAGGGGLRYRF